MMKIEYKTQDICQFPLALSLRNFLLLNPPSFYRVFATKELLTARFVAELTKVELYRRKRKWEKIIPV